MGRDHSEKCDVCGYMRGGFDDLPCLCDAPALDVDAVMRRVADLEIESRLANLGSSLRIAGGLCAAFRQGAHSQWNWDQLCEEVQWTPNTEARPAPGYTGGDGGEWLLAPQAGGAVPLELLASKRYEEVVAPGIPGAAPKRPPSISAEASARRRPLPPQALLSGEIPSKPSAQRLLASKPLKVKRNG